MVRCEVCLETEGSDSGHGAVLCDACKPEDVTQANILANWYAKMGSSAALATLYSDGLILYLAVTAETQQRIVELLGKQVIESARSKNQFCGVVICKPTRWMRTMDRVAKVVALEFCDNRQQDAYKIDHYIEIIRATR